MSCAYLLSFSNVLRVLTEASDEDLEWCVGHHFGQAATSETSLVLIHLCVRYSSGWFQIPEQRFRLRPAYQVQKGWGY